MEAKNKTWNLIDSLAKLLPGIGAIIAGVFIPLVLNQNAEKNRNNQLYVEIVSKREMADSELRAKMFEILIGSFFSDKSNDTSDNEKLTKLRLIALNFHETFDFKPLFEELESEFNNGKKSRESIERLQKLRNISNEIVGKQEALLSQVTEGQMFDEIIYEGLENGILIPPDSHKAYKGHRLGITLTKIAKDDSYIRIRVLDMPELKKEDNVTIGDVVDVEFDLGFYDLPFIDNTKLFNGTRFAITFKGVVTDSLGRNAAKIKIMFFPESYMSSRDRPYLDEMLQHLNKGASRI